MGMTDWDKQIEDDEFRAMEHNESDQLSNSIRLLKQMEAIDSCSALNKVKRKIDTGKHRKWIMVLQRVAAILVLPLLTFIIWQNIQLNSLKENIVEHQISTPPTLRSNFILPDGTTVWMNGNTTLNYPEKFVGNERLVELNGEAYFEVAPNKKQPFIVKMGDLLVEATGTEFNISTYSNDTKQEVLLTEGSVNLQLQKNAQRVSILNLKVNELAVYDKVNHKMNVKIVDPEKYTAWKQGRIIFKNDLLEDVIIKLERWYNIDFDYNDNMNDSYAFTGTFEGEDLARILNCIEITTPIHFEVLPPVKDQNNKYSKTQIKITPMSK